MIKMTIPKLQKHTDRFTETKNIKFKGAGIW